MFENPLITAGILAELALVAAIDYTKLGNATFGTAPIGYRVWLSVLPFAVAMLAFEEARKAVVRRRERTVTATGKQSVQVAALRKS
jgi:sodium/potassium-transporting ATPase subunit alpha